MEIEDCDNMLISINQLLPEEIGHRISNLFKIQNKNENKIIIKLKNPIIRGADGEQLEISQLHHGFNINDHGQLIVDIDCRCGAGTFNRALKTYNHYMPNPGFTDDSYGYKFNCSDFNDLISQIINYFRMCLILWGIAFGLDKNHTTKPAKNKVNSWQYHHQNRLPKSASTDSNIAKNANMAKNKDTSNSISNYPSTKSLKSQNNHKSYLQNSVIPSSSSSNQVKASSALTSLSHSQIAKFDKSVTASIRSNWSKHNSYASNGATLTDDIKSRMNTSYDSNVTNIKGISNSQSKNSAAHHHKGPIKSGRPLSSIVLKAKAIKFAKTVPVFKETQLTNRFPIGNARAKKLYDYLDKKSLIRKKKSQAN